MRRLGVVVVAGVLLTAAPASADTTGVTVGPGRQLVEPGQRIAPVYVANPTGRTMTVSVSEWAYTEGGWTEEDVAGLAVPAVPFELAPHAQAEVRVAVPAVEVPCRLVGVGFSVLVETGQGITARGVGLAQLALQGRGASEADCLAILPNPPATPSGFPWWVLAGVLVGAVWYAVHRWRYRPVTLDVRL